MKAKKDQVLSVSTSSAGNAWQLGLISVPEVKVAMQLIVFFGRTTFLPKVCEARILRLL